MGKVKYNSRLTPVTRYRHEVVDPPFFFLVGHRLTSLMVLLTLGLVNPLVCMKPF